MATVSDSLSKELMEAVTGVDLFAGQNVIVRTKSGERVTDGQIVYVDGPRNMIRLSMGKAWTSDVGSDIDLSRYDVYVVDPKDVPVETKPLASGPRRRPA